MALSDATIAYLRDAFRVCGAAWLSGAAAAQALGEITDDLGPQLPVRFRPRDAAFEAGEAARAFEADECAHVTLRCGEARPTLGEVAAAFGAYQPVRAVSWDDPTRAVITLEQPGLACDCALLATVEGDEVADAAPVKSLLIRRDRRTG